MSATAVPSVRRRTGRRGGESRHKIQCPRIMEQREFCKERKKEEVKREAGDIVDMQDAGAMVESVDQILNGEAAIDVERASEIYAQLQRGDPEVAEQVKRLKRLM